MDFKKIISERWRKHQLQVARTRIQKAKSVSVGIGDIRNLNLKNLGITDTELQELMPEIQSIPGLQGLNLSRNKLTTLPDGIVALTDLTYLNLKKNKLATLPENLGALTELRNLQLGENELESLPDSITNLGNLKYLNLQNNKLESLPEQIGNLKNLLFLRLQDNNLKTLPDTIGGLERLKKLNLSNNALGTLSIQAILLLNQELRINVKDNQQLLPSQVQLLQGRFPALKTSMKELNALVLLEKFYGNDADQRHAAIKGLKLGRFKIEGKWRTRGVDAVLKEFLRKVPTVGPHSDIVYRPAAKSLLDTILDPNKSKADRKTAVQNIATSLGDCGTPVRNFLTQVIIGECKASEGPISEDINKVITAMAVEEAIKRDLKNLIKPPEQIEKVQALVNSLFLQGADEMPQNKLIRIEGSRDFLPSVSQYPEFGFTQIKEDLALGFAKMCCKTNDEGSLLVTEDGKYLADEAKISAIVKPYFADLGIVSEREKQVKRYKVRLQELLMAHELSDYIDNPKVMDLLDFEKQGKELREVLRVTPDADIEKVSASFQAQKEAEIIEIAKERKDLEQRPLKDMKSPTNTKLPSPRPGSGVPVIPPKGRTNARTSRPSV